MSRPCKCIVHTYIQMCARSQWAIHTATLSFRVCVTENHISASYLCSSHHHERDAAPQTQVLKDASPEQTIWARRLNFPKQTCVIGRAFGDSYFYSGIFVDDNTDDTRRWYEYHERMRTAHSQLDSLSLECCGNIEHVCSPFHCRDALRH